MHLLGTLHSADFKLKMSTSNLNCNKNNFNEKSKVVEHVIAVTQINKYYRHEAYLFTFFKKASL